MTPSGTRAGVSAPRGCVTGAGGFIASHLVEALLLQGWQVTAFVHYTGRGDWGWLEAHHADPPPGLSVVRGDITDPHVVAAALAGCDVVFHLAALVAVPYSYEAPASYFRTNVDGTLNVVEAVRRHRVRRLVHTSTSEVYGSACRPLVDEGHPLQAQSPYAASKIAADKVVESYVRSYDLPAVTVRPFNTYGPRQSARAVVPTIISQALAGPVVRLGALAPVRDLTFVSDTVAGLIAAAGAAGVKGEVVNLGSGEAVSVGELAQMILDLVGSAAGVVVDPKRARAAHSEVQRLVSDHGKAQRLLGWQPAVPLRDGLRATVEWMRERAAFYRPEEYST